MNLRDIFKPQNEASGTRPTGGGTPAGGGLFRALPGTPLPSAQPSTGAGQPGNPSGGSSVLSKFWGSLTGGSKTPEPTQPTLVNRAPFSSVPTPVGQSTPPKGVIPKIENAFNEAKRLKVDSTIQNPTKISTVEMPSTGDERKDKALSEYRNTVTELSSQAWIDKYRGQDIDKSLADLKKQIDKAPSSTNDDLVARAKLIAEYQFLESAKNYGIYTNYDLQGGYDQVAKMDKQILDLEDKMRRYNDAQTGNYTEAWLVDENRDAAVAKAGNITADEYERMRADHAALEEYRAALKREVDDAKRIQLGAIYASMAADPKFDEIAKKGAMKGGNKRVETSGGLFPYMTEDEQKMYDVIFASGSEKDVETYLEYLEPTLIQRKGLGRAEKIDKFFGDSWAGNAAQTLAAAGIGTANAFIDSSIDTALGTLSGLTWNRNKKERELNTWDYTSGALRDKTSEMGGKNGKNFGTVMVDAATSGGRMGPMILSSAILTQLGAPEAAIKLVPAAIMSTGIYSSVKDEMTRMGYNEKSAATYAALSAASETVVGAAIGGFSEIGGIMNVPGVKDYIGKIDSAFWRVATTMVVKAHAEGQEEYIQDTIDPLFKDLAFGGAHDFEVVSEEAIYSYLVAALSVGLSETAPTISDTLRCDATGAYFNAVRNANPELYDALINDAIENGNDEIKEFAENLKSGEYKANNGNVGELVLMMTREGKFKSPQEIVKKTAEHLADLKIDSIMSEARSKAQAEWDQIVASHPEALVLNPVETELAKRTGWDAETVKEQGEILTKIVSGIIPTNADINTLDMNNRHVRDIFKQYTGIDLDTAYDTAERKLRLLQGARAAAQTEAYQQALKEANEAYLQQRDKLLSAGGLFMDARTDNLMETEFASKAEEAQQSAMAGTDIQPGRASLFKGKRQPIIPAAKKAGTTNTPAGTTSAATGGTGNAPDTTVVNIGGVSMSHDDFVERYMERNKVSRAKAEEAWNKALRTNSALNGGNVNEQVRGTDEGRVDDVASGGSVSEVDEGRAGSGQSEADTGAAEASRGGTTIDAEGLRTPGRVIAETEYTEEQTAFVQECKDAGFSSVTLVDGDVLAPNGKKLNAKVDTKTGALTISANDPEYMRKVARHERVHLWLQSKGGRKAEFVRATLDSIIPKKMLSKLFDAYLAVYADMYLESSLDGLIDNVYEEILCDMYGGLDNYGVKAGAYLSAATKAIDKSGIRESYLSSASTSTAQTSQVETTITEQATQEAATRTGPPDDGIEEKVLRDLGVDDEEESLPDLNDLLNEEDYDGEYNPAFDEYFSVANTDEEIKEKLLTPETRQALEKNDLTIQDGVVVTNENAELMRTEGYQKPQDWYSVVDEKKWEKNYKKTPGADQDVIDFMRRVTDWAISNEAVYNYLPHGEYAKSKFGPLRSNIEYVVSFDMDTSCPRTFQYLHIRDQLQKLANRPLTFNESINLLNLMKKMNQMIPCTYCYVENKRIVKSNSYLNYFDARDGVMSAATDEAAKSKMYGYDPSKDRLGDAAQQVFEQWRADVANGTAFHPSADECWNRVVVARGYVNNWLDSLLENKQITKKTSRQKLIDMTAKQFGVTDKAALAEINNFVSQWLYDVKAGNPHKMEFRVTGVRPFDQRYLTVHHAAMNYASSVSQARGIDNYTPYIDQLKNISAKQKAFIMGMGGIRKHSSNDFRMDYIYDYLMFYADLAAQGWTGHTYTKSTEYCKIFGRTGDRINLSIAMDTETVTDENGNPKQRVVMNDQEGANWRDAKKLREAYYDNLGTMAMVTDDLQLSYALNSDWIDMIIPFHASGLPKSVWYNMKAWCDYTSSQNERFLNSTEMRAALEERGFPISSKTSVEEIARMYEEEFGIKKLYNKNGNRKEPHFYPNDTYVEGPNGEQQLVPGHHNNAETYFELCREYGVHPRFDGIEVTNAEGKTIPVTEHPNYLKLIKETARTETEQHPIEFTFDQHDDFLGMTTMEYIQEGLQQEAKSGGYESAKVDPIGLVGLFKKDYLGKDREIGYISKAAQFKIDAYEGTTAYKEIEAKALGLSNANDLQKLHKTPEAQMGLTERASVADLTQGRTEGYNESTRGDENGSESVYTRGQRETKDRFDERVSGRNWESAALEGIRRGDTGLLPKELWRTTELRSRRVTDTATRFFREGNTYMGRPIDAKIALADGSTLEYGVQEFLDNLYRDKFKYPDTWKQDLRRDVTNADRLIRGLDTALNRKDSTDFPKNFHPTEADQAYLQAVKTNDAPELYRMVKEAAEQAGYTMDVYQHSNGADRFETFSKGELGFHIGSWSQAAHAVNRGWRDQDSPSMLLHLYTNIKSPYKLRDGRDLGTWTVGKTARALVQDIDVGYEPAAALAPYRAELEDLQRFYDERDYNSPSRRALTNILEKAGFDAIQYQNWFEGDDRDSHDAYIVWAPEQLKSADLITYDRKGKVIPLSQRFDSDWEEYRYSVASEDTDARTDTGDGRSSLDADVEQEPVISPEVAAQEVEKTDERYSIRTEDPPKKTMIGYKVFRVDKDHPGQLYPTKVENPGGQGTPVGVWLNADTGEIARNKDGSIKTNSRGRIAVKADGGTLAWRPGWHLGSLPEANQMNQYDPNNPDADRVSEGVMHDDYVFCECEFAADEDYQLEAFQMGFNEKGNYVHSQAGLPYIPKDGYYKYRTNPDPNTAPWYISGAIKITKILDDPMRREIIEKWNAEHPDEPPMRIAPRYSGKDIDLSEYKLTAGDVTPTENLGEIAPGVDYSDEIKNLPGYQPSHINWENKNFQNAFTINQIEERREELRQKYEANQERYSVSENENNQFPEGTLAHEMLDLIRAEGPEGLEKWVNNMLEKNAEQKEQRGTKPLIPPADKQLPVGKVERAIQRGELDKAIEQYGRLRPGENPSRDIALPKKTGKDSYVRRFFQNAEEAKGVSQRTVEMVERGIITHEDVATYARISDTKANHAADTLLDRFGYNGLMKKWNDEITSVSNRPTKYDIAVGERLLIEADRNGDSATATKIIADLATMGTEAGQVVQAMRLLKKLGPVGQLYYMQRAIDKMNKKYQGRIAKGKMDPIQINQELAQNVLLAETQEDIDKAMKALIKDTANKLPVNLKDKWDAWRYLAMLGNPRTHIRNVFGNLFFQPVRFTKDLLAAAGESIFIRDRSERTKSAAYLLGRPAYRALTEFATSDFEVMKGDITGTGKMNLTNELLEARDVFKHLKFLNKLSEFNSEKLEQEDAIFLKKAYVSAMAEYMAARGLTAQDLSEDTRELNQARQYAALEAQKATYRDFSWFASALNNLKHSNSVASALLDGVLPFTKTPMNILSRGLEYSPLGLIKGLTIDLAKVQKGDLTAAEAIDHIAGGMTGTMVAVLGAMLAHLGIARGSDDDDKKKAELERAQGHQEYSLEIGGKSFTVDWVAPISLPFFVGVEAYNQITQGGPMDFWDFCDVMTLIAEPMLSLSMLDGVNNMLTSASYADNNAIQSIMMSIGTSYLSQGLPTLGAQIARTIDPYRRATYIDKNSNTPTWLQQFVQQNQGKIPGLASEKMAYTDIWGRKQSTGAWGLRALENIVFPFYMKNLRTNPVETELFRLSKATGDNSMLPSTLSKSFSIDGESINLTAKQYEKAKSTYGKTSLKLLGDLMGTQAYAAMDDEQKAAAIKNALTVSAAVGRKAVKEDYAPAAWVQRAIDQDNFEDAVMFHTLQNMETGLTNYQIIECMYWLTPEDQGKLILSQFTPQAKMTDYTQKKYKFELDDSMKARQREIYEEQFWIAYPGLVSSQQWLAADIAGRAELVKELQTALGKQARTIYGDELRRAGVKSVYSDDPQTEAEEIAALINELGYNE